MGLYETTVLYHGRLLSPVGFQRLAGRKTSGYITGVCKNRWILHAPGKHMVVGDTDAVIERHEKEAGRIEHAEVDRMLSRRPARQQLWESTTEEQTNYLRELVKVAAADEKAVPGTYMCEVAWSTLEPSSISEELTYNLKVV